MQIGHILVDRFIQHLVGLVQNLHQMGGALLIDRLRHKFGILDTGNNQCSHHKQHGGRCGKPAFDAVLLMLVPARAKLDAVLLLSHFHPSKRCSFPARQEVRCLRKHSPAMRF